MFYLSILCCSSRTTNVPHDACAIFTTNHTGAVLLIIYWLSVQRHLPSSGSPRRSLFPSVPSCRHLRRASTSRTQFVGSCVITRVVICGLMLFYELPRSFPALESRRFKMSLYQYEVILHAFGFLLECFSDYWLYAENFATGVLVSHHAKVAGTRGITSVTLEDGSIDMDIGTCPSCFESG